MTLIYGWKFIKEQARENWKISLGVSLFFVFLLGFIVGAVIFKPDPRPIFEITEIDDCLERLSYGVLIFEIDEITKNCIWPIPSHAVCNFDVCGHAIKTEVTGIQ